MKRRGPRGDGVKMTETVVSGSVKQLLTMAGAEWYSSEVGFVGNWDPTEDGGWKARPRRGGTRTTPGWPDIAALCTRPHRYMLTVEAKGTTTKIRVDQWLYALRAMRNGQPHLIVRSGESLVFGLWWLGLLPRHWMAAPPLPMYSLYPPENALYLPRTRFLYWQQMRVTPEYELPSVQWLQRLELPEPPHPEGIYRSDDYVWE
jgi:hypothetical protein